MISEILGGGGGPSRPRPGSLNSEKCLDRVGLITMLEKQSCIFESLLHSDIHESYRTNENPSYTCIPFTLRYKAILGYIDSLTQELNI